MGVLNPNSTNYVHPNEPNLLDLTTAMTYDPINGEPHLRVTLGSDTITISGDVNLIDSVRVNNSTTNPVPVFLTNPLTTSTVYQGTIPWITNTTVTNWPAVQYVNGVLYAVQSGTWNVGVTGNVTVDNFTSTVNIASMPAVTGTVSVSNTLTISNTSFAVTNFPTTSTVYQGTTPWVVTGTVNIGTLPEVEIKNDTGNPIPISATTAANTALNPIYITGAVTTAGGSAQGKLWFFQIAQGLIAGHRAVFKAGYNPSIANNTEESLWSHSVIYPWSAWGAGGTLSCVSASASDTGVLYITGLKASDWTEVTELVTMTGTTPVVTTNSFIRINNLSYSGSDTNVGEIHTYRNGGVVGYIGVGEGQGQMAQFSVPAGYTAYLLNGNANMGKGNDGVGKFKYRLYGSSFQTAMTFLLFQSTFDYKFEAPLALPEKSDLDVIILASISGTAAGCAYSLILIAN